MSDVTQIVLQVVGMLAMGWRGGPGTYNGVVLYTVLALPVVLLLVLIRPSAWATVGLLYGTVPWLWMTMIRGGGAGVVPGRVSLVPFKDLLEMGAFQAVGNLLVLGALGFFGPIRFVALRSVKRVVIVAACCSAAIEIAQYVLMLDRVSSIDDFFLNTAGAGLAAMLSRRWWLTEPALQTRFGYLAPIQGRFNGACD
jgi:glycopeptide antibiotics resistance protein